MDLQDQQVLGQLVPLAQLVLPVQLAHKETLDPQDLVDRKVMLDQLVPQGELAHRVTLVQQAQQAHRVM